MKNIRYLFLIFLSHCALGKQCDVSIKFRDFRTFECRQEYDKSKCVDSCSDPANQVDGSCFKAVKIPCEIKNKLASYESDGYVDINEILKWKEKLSTSDLKRYNIVQPLYGKIANIAAANDNGLHSKSSMVVVKDSYRQYAIKAADNLNNSIINQVLAFKFERVALYEKELIRKVNHIIDIINSSQILESIEKQDIISEFYARLDQRKFYTDTLESLGRNALRKSRIDYLKSKLGILKENYNLLNEKHKNSILKNLESITYAWFLECIKSKKSACSRLESNSLEMPDNILTEIDEHIDLASKEAEFVLKSYDYTDGNEFLDERFVAKRFQNINDFFTMPDDHQIYKEIVKLVDAWNLIYHRNNEKGVAFFESLLNTNIKTIDGSSFISLFSDERPVQLCSAFNVTTEDLNSITALLHTARPFHYPASLGL